MGARILSDWKIFIKKFSPHREAKENKSTIEKKNAHDKTCVKKCKCSPINKAKVEGVDKCVEKEKYE